MRANSEREDFRFGTPLNNSLKVCVQESHVTQRKSNTFGCYAS